MPDLGFTAQEHTRALLNSPQQPHADNKKKISIKTSFIEECEQNHENITPPRHDEGSESRRATEGQERHGTADGQTEADELTQETR